MIFVNFKFKNHINILSNWGNFSHQINTIDLRSQYIDFVSQYSFGWYGISTELFNNKSRSYL